MTLLDFARGPALAVSLTVFALGTMWRLAHVLMRPRLLDLSTARAGTPANWVGAWHGVWRGMWPRKDFVGSTWFVAANGYVFHIGLALVFFAYAPHIAFVRRLTGLTWPALPDAVMYLAAGATMISLLMALLIRLTSPVHRLISKTDDTITWMVTFLPLLTGRAVTAEPSAGVLARTYVIYGGPLAVHLLALELLLLWFPFGKLMHAFLFVFSRGATGMRFNRRGVRV
jgi:nitrate reductase gamma subunit